MSRIVRHLVLFSRQLHVKRISFSRDGLQLRVEHAFNGMHVLLYRFGGRRECMEPALV
jgi:hypothetical protein